jgi:hypothetical protein
VDDGIVKEEMLFSKAPETISTASDVLPNISVFFFYLLCEDSFSILAVLEREREQTAKNKKKK